MTFGIDAFSTETLDDGTHVVYAHGEIDSSSAPVLQRALLAAPAAGHERVVLDLSGVSFLDSSGVGAVMAGYAEAQERRARFAVVCTDNHAAQRIRIMGLDNLLDIFPSREDALRQIRSG